MTTGVIKKSKDLDVVGLGLNAAADCDGSIACQEPDKL